MYQNVLEIPPDTTEESQIEYYEKSTIILTDNTDERDLDFFKDLVRAAEHDDGAAYIRALNFHPHSITDIAISGPLNRCGEWVCGLGGGKQGPSLVSMLEHVIFDYHLAMSKGDLRREQKRLKDFRSKRQDYQKNGIFPNICSKFLKEAREVLQGKKFRFLRRTAKSHGFVRPHYSKEELVKIYARITKCEKVIADEHGVHVEIRFLDPKMEAKLPGLLRRSLRTMGMSVGSYDHLPDVKIFN